MNINIHDAVRAAYSNVATIYGNDVNSLVIHDVNGNLISIDPSLVNAQIPILQAQLEASEQAKETTKASAFSKLAALGLTQDEVNSLVG